MSKRLPDSKRNEIIANFNEGKLDPDYEVIPSQTQKGKYTVRKRKVSLPISDVPESTPVQPQEQAPVQEQNDEDSDSEDENIPYQYNQYMYQDYQMMLNKMIIEQMKMMRQQMKYSNKKQQKLKGKSQRIYDILTELAHSEPEPEQVEKPAQEPEHETEEEEQHEHVQENTTNYFEGNYKNTQPVKEIIPEKPLVEPEPPKYKQEYEHKIDEIGGLVRFPSRRDRLNFKNFNI